VLIWVRLSRTPWREIGFVRPDSWIRTAAIGIVLGVTLKFLLKMIVMPSSSGCPDFDRDHYRRIVCRWPWSLESNVAHLIFK